jgi:hypothetical protein
VATARRSSSTRAPRPEALAGGGLRRSSISASAGLQELAALVEAGGSDLEVAAQLGTGRRRSSSGRRASAMARPCSASCRPPRPRARAGGLELGDAVPRRGGPDPPARTDLPARVTSLLGHGVGAVALVPGQRRRRRPLRPVGVAVHGLGRRRPLGHGGPREPLLGPVASSSAVSSAATRWLPSCSSASSSAAPVAPAPTGRCATRWCRSGHRAGDHHGGVGWARATSTASAHSPSITTAPTSRASSSGVDVGRVP